MKKIAFIGAGKMAEALISGVINSGTISPVGIIAGDIDAGRISHIQESFRVAVTTDNAEAVKDSEIIVLAVKPQNMDTILTELAAVDLAEKIIISIAAGVTVDRIRRKLTGKVKLVRVMPNAPALVGKGISALHFSGDFSEEEKRRVVSIFESIGEVVPMDESLIDQATAISGSGPAYFFYFVQKLIEAGEKTGLKPEIAARLVKATFYGSARLMESTAQEPERLIEMVASKGGTTEAALNSFEEGKISDIITGGVIAALNRAEELDSIS